MNEKILCILKSVWEKHAGKFEEFLYGHPWLLGIFEKFGVYKLRSQVENDPEWLQLIPYIVLEHAGRLAMYQRGYGSGESRLLDKLSIGVGGHVQENIHIGIGEIIAQETMREIKEEFVTGTLMRNIPIGWIFDPDTDVGKVHLGIASIWEVSSGVLQANSDEIASVCWADWKVLQDNYNKMESWSQIILSNIQGIYYFGKPRVTSFF